MTAFGQLVVGAAGAGKSSYCAALDKYIAEISSDPKRTVRVVNLDPGVEHRLQTTQAIASTLPDSLTGNSGDVRYWADICDLIDVVSVMKDENLGPNGALLYCYDYLADNLSWFDEIVDTDAEDYYIFDLPGQIELYTHSTSMQRIIKYLQRQLEMRLCVVFLIDSQFATDVLKFVSCAMCALSCMINFELPHINLITKIDKLHEDDYRFLKYLISQRINDPESIKDILDGNLKHFYAFKNSRQHFIQNHSDLVLKFSEILQKFDYVQFMPLSIKKSKMMSHVLLNIDMILQYHELREPKERFYDTAQEVD